MGRLGALYRLNGMFAFAVWDRAKRTLFLARDRFGVKPIYYTKVDGAFLFASEIKAFRGFPGFEARLGSGRPCRVSDVPEFLHRPHACLPA